MKSAIHLHATLARLDGNPGGVFQTDSSERWSEREVPYVSTMEMLMCKVPLKAKRVPHYLEEVAER